MAHDEKTDREILLLVVQKLDMHLGHHEKVHEGIEKRLDSHSSQLKMLWSGGGLGATIAALLGLRNH